jgi:alpha,alpha-trehalose phosphorylase
MNYFKKQKIEVELEKAFEKGWDYYEKFQKEYLEKFWNDSYIKIDGDDALTQGIRFNMFHLLQSTGKDGYTNIGAKGLTGEGYEGHYFWDTETYVLPFFLYTQPETAKKLLEFRYNTLDAARDRAKEMSHTKGALYPWRTINGYECSSYYPAGTAQYHINADIAFALKQYYQVTDDFDFIKSMGIEILAETARLWEDAGSYNSEGQFCINCVTGPDEYTALINNNYYTNLMAAENLSFASEMVEKIKTESPEIYQELKNKLKLSEEEHFGWEKHAEKMFYPYDEKLKINAQDDSFLSKPIWELDKTPKEKFPLLLNYHPLVLYRYQVIKQADLILAEALLPHKFSDEQVKRDYDYYEKLTTHDSSLSTCIYSIVANRIGYEKEAYEYFINTSRTDLDNYQGNTKDGIHSASMAGTWLGVVMGFGGMKIYNNELHFDPKIPEKWNEYTFKIKFKNRIIKVKVDKTKADYSLEKGEPLTIYNKGNKIELS